MLFDGDDLSRTLYTKYRKDAIRSALLEDLYYRGIPPGEANALVDVVLNAIGNDILEAQINNGEFSTSGQIKDFVKDATQYIGGTDKSFLDELPEEVVASIFKVAKDSAVVGLSSALFAGADAYTFSYVLDKVLKATGSVLPAGKAIKVALWLAQGAQFAYKYYKHGNIDQYIRAIYGTPRSHAEAEEFADLREKFARENENYFSYDEAQQIRNGTYKDNKKLFKVLNKTNFFEKTMDVLFEPVTSLDKSTIGAKDRIYTNFPDYNQHVDSVASIFGGLTGNWLHSNVGPNANHGVMMITTPEGKQVPVANVDRKAINNARKKLNEQFQPKGYKQGPQEQLYNQHWDNWANGKGNVFFQPLSSNENIFYNPHFRHGLSALVVGGIDAVLDKVFQDPATKYLWGGLVHASTGFGNAFLDDFYYRLQNQKLQKNYQSFVNTFRNMAKDYNGTMSMEGNNSVFTMPDINTQVTLTPEGLVSTKPLKPTVPSKKVSGKVTPYEYKKTQSPSIVSLTAVSELLDVDVPNFVRADLQI